MMKLRPQGSYQQKFFYGIHDNLHQISLAHTRVFPWLGDAIQRQNLVLVIDATKTSAQLNMSLA